MIDNVKVGRGYAWTTEDESRLLDMYGRMNIEELALLMQRSIKSINRKIIKLMGTSNIYEVSGSYRLSEVADITGRHELTIKNRVNNDKFATCIKIGNRYTFDYDEVWSWLSDNKNFIKFDKVNIDSLSLYPEWYEKLHKCYTSNN